MLYGEQAVEAVKMAVRDVNDHTDGLYDDLLPGGVDIQMVFNDTSNGAGTPKPTTALNNLLWQLRLVAI